MEITENPFCTEGITKNEMILIILVAFYFLNMASCSDNKTTKGPLDIDAACANVLEYCQTEYNWVYYYTSEASCQRGFNTCLDLYGAYCLETFVDGIRCLSGIPSSSVCSICESYFEELDQYCSFPPIECY